MVHDSHAPFANLLQQLVGTDLGAGEFQGGVVDGGSGAARREFQKTAWVGMRPQEHLHTFTQVGITFARGIEKRRTLVLGLLQGLVEKLLFNHAHSPRFMAALYIDKRDKLPASTTEFPKNFRRLLQRPRTSVCSQARANAQWRSAVLGEMPSTSAAWSPVNPAK